MKRVAIYFVLFASALLLSPISRKAQDDGVITIRLSYKVVLNPANGTRPPGVTNADINTAVNGMNDLMRGYFRGYRFQLVEILDVGGMSNPPTGPSVWYDTDFFNTTNGSVWKDQMEAAAMADSAYLWRANSVNIYITNGICGGKCSFPGDGDNIMIFGGCSDDAAWLQLHEIGHYFSLCHTQGCVCGCVGSDPCGGIPGDDGIADTLPDLSSWNRDQIANNSFGQPYAGLSAAQQNQVDDVFLNIMSYHNSACGLGAPVARLTDQQLDRWAHSANLDRVAIRTGRTIFAQSTAPSGGNGSPASPYNTMTNAVGSAASDSAPDIIILRPGSFNQPLTINTPVTLRATHQGAAAIGSPNNP